MATIVNNPGPSERVIERSSGDATAGWAIAIIILIAIVIGAFAWVRYHGAAPYAPSTGQPAGGSANINVTVPSGSGGGTTGGSGASGGASGAGGSGY